MTICRYFQQGTCRYGNRCRFQHVYPNSHSYGGGYGGGGGNNYGGQGGYRASGGSNYYTSNYDYGSGHGSGGGGGNERGGTSILRSKVANQFQQSNSVFGQPASNNPSYQPSSGFFNSNVPDQKSASAQFDVKEIMQMLINEFTIWENSGQWPLSCFSFSKERNCLPGLIDYSPEEIRWLLYQARTSGNLEEWQQLIKGIYDKAKLVKEQLITPSAEVFDLLHRISRGEKIEAPVAPAFPDPTSTSTSMFGNVSGGNVMQSPVATSFSFSLPSNPPPTASNQNFTAFGVPQGNAFPNNFSNSMFGNASTPNANPSIFGGATQTSQIPQTVNSPPASGFFTSNTNLQVNNDSLMYTPMEDVTEEMLNAFNAPVYRMGFVPIKPPPKELCGLRS